MSDQFFDKEEWTLWEWPFFDEAHYQLAGQVRDWLKSAHDIHGDDLFGRYRALVRAMGAAGFLDYLIVPEGQRHDVRSICLIREAMTYDEALFDALFTMQGIGTLALQKHGTAEQKARYLDACRRGEAIAAFALTEPEGGSDAAATATMAVEEGDAYVLNGAKTLISNAGFADHYIVIARTGEAPGARGLSAFIVDADTPGLSVGEQIDFIADHPAASLTFENCRIPKNALIGERGQGFKVAMGAFDIFRPSVGAAAVGLSRRAFRETLGRVKARKLFGNAMGELQGVQMTLADIATDIDTAALSVYRAAWLHDVRHEGGSYAPSLAKLAATEAAARVVDRCVQLCGGAGVTRGNLIEKLYREARPMRIYEGTSEVQKLIIGRSLLAGRVKP